MSVLVKNMAMPETCDECNFHCYEGNGDYACVVTLSLANSKGVREDWCPLVEVPTPHGDLIDRNALNIGEYEREDDDSGTLEINLSGLLSIYYGVKDALPVIEAEVTE